MGGTLWGTVKYMRSVEARLRKELKDERRDTSVREDATSLFISELFSL